MSLVLLPLRLGAEHETKSYATTVLPIEDDSTLTDAIFLLPTLPVTSDLWTYFGRNNPLGESMAATFTDGYGSPLHMVRVRRLLSIPEAEWDRTGGRTIAAYEYLRAIDSEQYVVLYWD